MCNDLPGAPVGLESGSKGYVQPKDNLEGHIPAIEQHEGVKISKLREGKRRTWHIEITSDPESLKPFRYH